MSQILPEPIESYVASLARGSDPILERVAAEGRERDLPLVNREVGTLLQILTMAIGARRVLEIGTAIGYSGIWIARGLPGDGLLLSMEIDPARAEIARANFERAGVADRANVMVGDAGRMLAKVAGPFDLVFQDGDKRQYGPQLDRLVQLLRPGGLLVTDNVLWNGEVVPGHAQSSRGSSEITNAIIAYNERLASDPRLLTTFLPLRDGVAVSLRRPTDQ